MGRAAALPYQIVVGRRCRAAPSIPPTTESHARVRNTANPLRSSPIPPAPARSSPHRAADDESRPVEKPSSEELTPTFATIPDADWNEEIAQDLKSEDLSELIVYSRDWTIETINNQIAKENIDLAPAFQRRNAWNDDRRSKLIESLIAGLPVPEIVLAENPQKRGAFIVIDGKQRLLTMKLSMSVPKASQ